MKFLNLSIFLFHQIFQKLQKKVTEEKETKLVHLGPAHQIALVGVNMKFITTGDN
jgi:hypothetical protein